MKDKEERGGRKERDGRERGRQRKEEIFLRALMEILRIVTFLLLQPLTLCLKKKKGTFSSQYDWASERVSKLESLRLVLLLMSHMCVQHHGGVPGWSPQGTSQSD